MFDVKRLDATVRQGARTLEGLYYEDRKEAGIELKRKYRPGGRQYKGVSNQSGGNSGSAKKAGKVSWKAGTGTGDRNRGQTRA